jgi:hypothetical protein
LCVRNYDILDGLENGADGAFKDFTQTFWNYLYEYNFIIPKLKIKQERKICKFMNNSL